MSLGSKSGHGLSLNEDNPRWQFRLLLKVVRHSVQVAHPPEPNCPSLLQALCLHSQQASMPNSDTHYSVPTSFPPFALGFLDEDTLVLGGGGGSSKSGVKNKVVCFKIRRS